MIRVRFIGFPKENDQLSTTDRQSQCLFETELDEAPAEGETVVINENIYVVHRRKWEFESNFDERRSLIKSRIVEKTLHVYLRN